VSASRSRVSANDVNRLEAFLAYGHWTVPPALQINRGQIGLGKIYQAAEALHVFGRADFRVAQAAYELWVAERAQYAMFTGGLGTDSGPILHQFNIPEGAFLAGLAHSLGIPAERIIAEVHAANGGDNCEFGYWAIVERLRRPPRRVILVGHATSMYRFAEQYATKHEAGGWSPVTIQSMPTDYPFDGDSPRDRAEAAGEMRRLATWPNQHNADGTPFLRPQEDLPPELVQVAQDIWVGELGRNW
jgi:hypothetical protein